MSISSFSAPSASASAAAAVSALMLCTTPSASGAIVDTTGIRRAAIRSSTAAVLTWSTSPTRPMSVATPSTVTLRRTAVNSWASSPVMPTAYGSVRVDQVDQFAADLTEQHHPRHVEHLGRGDPEAALEVACDAEPAAASR